VELHELAYDSIPMNVQYASGHSDDINSDGHVLDTSMNLTTGMRCPNSTNTGLFVTGEYIGQRVATGDGVMSLTGIRENISRRFDYYEVHPHPFRKEVTATTLPQNAWLQPSGAII
jgi:hypothetical protein